MQPTLTSDTCRVVNGVGETPGKILLHLAPKTRTQKGSGRAGNSRLFLRERKYAVIIEEYGKRYAEEVCRDGSKCIKA